MVSFQNLGGCLKEIMYKMLESQDLCKLIYYDNQIPLKSDDIEDTSILINTNIFPKPIVSDVTTVNKTQVYVYFNNFEKFNNSIYFKANQVIFDVITHSNLITLDEGDDFIRLYCIMRELNKLFDLKDGFGIGKMTFSDAFIIPVADLHTGIRMVFNITEVGKHG